MPSEKAIFNQFIREKKLKHSKQRENIIDVFLNIEKHMTLDELHGEVRRQYPDISFTTVYRTMKLLSESGLCRELHIRGGITRYEHVYGHTHHDHLICTVCGSCIEIIDLDIEKQQESIFVANGFIPSGHNMELYGVCPVCRKDRDIQ